MSQNGKSDMRGKRITVLSDEGRENFDRIFRKRNLIKDPDQENLRSEVERTFPRKPAPKKPTG